MEGRYKLEADLFKEMSKFTENQNFVLHDN